MTEIVLSPPDVELSPAEWAILSDGAVVVPTASRVIELRGPGMVDCLQGLLTNDVARPGPDSAIFGALLTPKGMIVTDLWALRETDRFLLVVPELGGASALEIFRRTLPPRLARVTDRTGELVVVAILGDQAGDVLTRAGFDPIPAAGMLVRTGTDAIVAAHGPAVPVRAHLVTPAGELDAVLRRLSQAGAVPGTEAHLTAGRIRTGWPALGAEIDERTLPQEVRFDEIEGVSYTKGCYTGQETVARVHFRGHPNRELRALAWPDGVRPVGRSVEHLGREVGTIRSSVTIGGRTLALTPLRREVPIGATVTAGGVDATVTPLPIPADLLPQ